MVCAAFKLSKSVFPLRAKDVVTGVLGQTSFMWFDISDTLLEEQDANLAILLQEMRLRGSRIDTTFVTVEAYRVANSKI